MTVYGPDGLHLVGTVRGELVYTAWARRVDARWLADQMDGPVGGVGFQPWPTPPTDPSPSTPSAAVPPSVAGGAVHAAPGASRNAHADGAGPLCCRPEGDPAPTAGEPRPVRHLDLDPSDVRACLEAPCPAVLIGSTEVSPTSAATIVARPLQAAAAHPFAPYLVPCAGRRRPPAPCVGPPPR